MAPSQRAISPPTPAPSPQPESRFLRNTSSRDGLDPQRIPMDTASSNEALPLINLLSSQFPLLDAKDRQAFLSRLIDLCSARELAQLSSLISPRLKVDFLSALPIEVSLHIVSYLDDPKTLSRASCVSRFWRSLVNDEQTWKIMCTRYRFRQLLVPPPTGLETPDNTFVEPIESTMDFETQPSDTMTASSQVLRGLYDSYRARGLDAATALSELKTLHELFLSKRARQMGIEERRRELHALQHEGTFMNLIQDTDFVARMTNASMSDEDKQVYQQLEDLVHHNPASSRDAHDASVGWLSTGPPTVRTMGNEFVPSTPNVSTLPNRGSATTPGLPLRDVGQTLSAHLASPTSRLGSMTSGLLTSLWDRTGASSTSTSDAGHAPSAGDHGHSVEGHTLTNEEDMQVDSEETLNSTTTDAGTLPSASTSDDAAASRRISSRRNKRWAPFTSRQSTLPEDDTESNSMMSGLGLGKPPIPPRTSQRATTLATQHGPSIDRQNESTPFSFPAAKRSMSSTFEGPRLSRKSKPFSYKTHFKLAYLTESNWLRGGRLLTQHVSSDESSGEGSIVTCLSIDDDWIVVGMANAKIHVFDARTGLFVKTLVGHSSGVWCLSLISKSSSGTSSFQPSAKGKNPAPSEPMDKEKPNTMCGAYPYDNDRPLYTPTPDLNLIHHDPRPIASTFSPEMHFINLPTDDPPSRDEPTKSSILEESQSRLPQQRSMPFLGDLSIPHDGDAVSVNSDASTFAKGASDTHSNPHSTRGAGLGSNFGSPCGSVAGYGNENAIVVSSGCDRDVRVWDLATGQCKFVLSGHRSTVRCLRVFDGRPLAISGSRDGTMRVWNVETGQLVHLLAGHQHSVRCLDIAGNLVASASYDCTGRIWNVDTGKCIHVLRGHYHQLYAIAFDGVHVATGSLDTTVRIWSAETGECLALLQAHTSLVGQLQLTDSTLITGGSDGKVIVFSLKQMKILYQLLAHSNSVTCLQFDDRFIVTGGNDGKVKLWNFRTGEFVRELCEGSDQVWKVSFRDDKCVVLCRRNEKTAIDVMSFRPIEDST